MKWRDRMQEYVRERSEGSLRNLEQARRECQDRERWKLFCCGHPLVGAPWRVDSIYLDLKKAFDKVPQKRLDMKIETCERK